MRYLHSVPTRRSSDLFARILVLMPRDLPISNGNLMINFDHEYNIRYVYYPHVGQDNQTVGDVSFFGVWCDGKFARSEEHTSELQSLTNLVCRLLLEKK